MWQTSDFRRPQESHQPIVVAFRGIQRPNEPKIRSPLAEASVIAEKNVEVIGAARGWLHRLVRPFNAHTSPSNSGGTTIRARSDSPFI
jgi:hypothetical protein